MLVSLGEIIVEKLREELFVEFVFRHTLCRLIACKQFPRFFR
jgi:hypothetical protein